MTEEGCDYSRTAHANWTRLATALKAAGKTFVGRYAVNDKSPDGRGVTWDEYRAMKEAGIDVFLYWQTTTSWMLGGWSAGVMGAENAQINIAAAGMPLSTPVYFAADFDATPEQQGMIDRCLQGAASILGVNRVGIYGGYHVVKRCYENKSAHWFCQTSAWSGGMLFEHAHLYQYAYNQYVDGTNCDWVRAYADDFGQALPPRPVPPEPPKYAEPKPWPTKRGQVGIRRVTTRGGEDATAHLLTCEVTCTKPNGTIPRADADAKSPATGPKIKQGEKRVVIAKLTVPGAKRPSYWYVLDTKERVGAAGFTPALPSA